MWIAISYLLCHQGIKYVFHYIRKSRSLKVADHSEVKNFKNTSFLLIFEGDLNDFSRLGKAKSIRPLLTKNHPVPTRAGILVTRLVVRRPGSSSTCIQHKKISLTLEIFLQWLTQQRGRTHQRRSPTTPSRPHLLRSSPSRRTRSSTWLPHTFNSI